MSGNATVSRRGLIMASGGVALVGVAGLGMRALSSAPAGATAGALAFVDPSIRQSRAFGEAFTTTVQLGSEDPVRLWRALTTPPRMVAGITGWADYLMMRQIAQEAGLRVRHEARHDAGSHRLRIGDGALVPTLVAAGGQWPAAVALAIAGTLGRPVADQPADARTLFSWSLA